MRKTLTTLLLLGTICYSANSQEREDFLSYNLYQIGSAKYKITDNGNVTTNLTNLSTNHFLYDLSFTLDNLYFRIDASALAGTFLDKVFGGEDKTFLQSTNLSIGYIFYNSPIKITSNSDLALGIAGFIDSASLHRNTIVPAIKENFGSFGFTVIADYQLGQKLNVFLEYSRGKLKRRDGVKSSKNELRTKVAYDVYNGIHLTLGASMQKYTKDENTINHDLKATTFSFGLLIK